MCHDLNIAALGPSCKLCFQTFALRCVGTYTTVQYAIVDMIIFLFALRMFVFRSLRCCLTLSFG